MSAKLLPLIDGRGYMIRTAIRYFMARLQHCNLWHMTVFVRAIFLAIAVWAPPIPGATFQETLQDSASTPRDIVRTIDGINYLVVSGEIVLPDGTVPPELAVWAIDNAFSRTPEERLSFTGNRFELLVAEAYALLYVDTPDQRYRGSFPLNKEELYEARRDGWLRLELEATHPIVVKVLDEEGHPASGAMVGTSGPFPPTITDSNGIANYCHVSGDLVNLVARQAESRGVRFMSDKLLDSLPADKPLELQMFRFSKEKVRIVDVAGKPIAGYSFSSNAYASDEVRSDPDGFMERFAGSSDSIVANDPDWRLVEVRPGEEFKTIVLSRKGPRVRIRGTCQPLDNRIAGALVSLGDNVYARVNELGEFSADVEPGKAYSLKIDEPDLISDCFRGVLATADGEQAAIPALTLERGVDMSLRVTRGMDQVPMSNQRLAISYTTASGSKRNINGLTDAQGIAEIHVHQGIVEMSVYAHFPDNADSLHGRASVEYPEGADAVAHVNLPPPDPQFKHEVHVIANDADEAGLADADVMVVDKYGNTISRGCSDASGRFRFETSALSMVVLARSSDGKKAGFQLLFSRDEVVVFPAPVEPVPADTPTVIRVPMRNTITYEGRLIDSDDKPMANQQVSLGTYTKAEGPLIGYSPRFYFTHTTVLTGADGTFRVAGIPAGSHVEIGRGPNSGGYSIRLAAIDEVAGKTDTIRLWPIRKDAMPMSVDSHAHGNDLDSALKEARRDNKPVLVACYRDSRYTPGFLKEGLFNVARVHEVSDFVIFSFNISLPNLHKSAVSDVVERLKLQLPDPVESSYAPNTEIELLILADDGTVINRATFCTTDEDVIEQIQEFLRESK